MVRASGSIQLLVLNVSVYLKDSKVLLHSSSAAIAEACCCNTGACCQGDGTCRISTPEDCTHLGEHYQGDGTTCADVDCGEGACCYAAFGSLCVFGTFLDCFEGGGSWQGFGTTCSPNPCPGICCTDCVINPMEPGCAFTLEADCTGTFYPDATDCSPCLTTCCFASTPDPPSPCCQRITLAECESMGGEAEGVCISCDDITCVCP
jgi:hypothetical protein